MKIHFHTRNTELIEDVNTFITHWKSDYSHFEVKTSGSTGIPKTIEIAKKHAEASAMATCKFLDLKPGNKCLLCLSPSTIGGKMMIVRSIINNMELHVVEPSSTPTKGLDHHFDFIAMVPYQLKETLSNSNPDFCSKVKIIVGGGPVSKELEKEVKDGKAQVYHTFGMTETISHIALRNISKGETVFRALPNITFSQRDEQLVIHAPNLGIEEMVTNDAVCLLDEYSFEWKGRTDFVINSGGIKIHPEMVENLLSELIDVPFFVLGIQDKALGERLIICVESDEYQINKTTLSPVLPKYHIPKEIHFFEKFVRTESGKIDRLATINQTPIDEKPLL